MPHQDDAKYEGSPEITKRLAENPHNVTIYIPCHYDFSQIEHVAPFLTRYGGKVFVYKWHALYKKMTDFYSNDPNITVHPFSAAEIIKQAAQEKKKHIVFMLTSSMAYTFGKVQLQIFQSLKTRLGERVSNVNVIGHCLYGCASCKGAQFKVPVYFARYFSKRLPYTEDDVRSWYFQPTAPHMNAIPVLVAPSTGETSMIIQTPILEYLLDLQNQGKYKFVFKLHPSAYNPGDFDPSYPPHALELENLKFIQKNFAVTDEAKPSLLPFLSAFQTLICDLHSTVAFVASYFAPKTILAWHNDADYEAIRDPKFVEQLNVFQTLPEVQTYLEQLPKPKGTNKFFVDMYGEPDGLEELKYGHLAEWPLTPVNTDRKPLNVNQLVDETVKEWTTILDSVDPTSEEDLTDTKNALGLPNEMVWVTPQAAAVPKQSGQPNGKVHKLRVLTLNLWHGGESGGQTPEGIASILLKSKADLIGLQEVSTKTTGDQSDAIHKALGSGWHCCKQGIPIKNAGCIWPTTIFSRYPITATGSKMGVTSKIEDVEVSLFNLHLPYKPYGPYQVRGIPYEDSPPLNDKEVVESARKSTTKHIDTVREEMKNTDGVQIVVGDFNEPSAIDWKMDSVLAGQQNKSVQWPTSSSLGGFSDTYRAIHPNSVLEPAFTYGQEDRIDFVLIGGKNWKIDDAGLLGTDEPKWLSDHFGSWADLSIWK